MSAFDLDNEDVSWNCDICGDKLGRDSYVTVVTTSTGEVIKAEDGRLIDMEPQFPAEIEHLCYSCWSKKYKEPVETLRTVLGVIANIIELVENLDDFDGLAVKEAVDKLNDLVVHIAGVLPKTTTLHLTAIIRKEALTEEEKTELLIRAGVDLSEPEYVDTGNLLKVIVRLQTRIEELEP